MIKLRSIGGKLLAVVLAGLTFRACTIETFRVSGVAMAPAVIPGDTIIAAKNAYGLRVPGSGSMIWGWSRIKRGDVVVLARVGEPPMTVARRIVGLPGETVRFEGGRYSVKENGEWREFPCEPLAEAADYCRERYGEKAVFVHQTETPVAPAGKPLDFELSSGEILVISDDRRDGPDSRHFGPVPIESIVGKATRIWIPARAENREFAVDKVLPVKIQDRGYLSPVL